MPGHRRGQIPVPQNGRVLDHRRDGRQLRGRQPQPGPGGHPHLRGNHPSRATDHGSRHTRDRASRHRQRNQPDPIRLVCRTQRALTELLRLNPSATLNDLPETLLRHASAVFGTRGDPETVREVLREEEQLFAALLRRGRLVVGRMLSRAPLTDGDYRMLHETYGLAPVAGD
jgi:hypothetical protein